MLDSWSETRWSGRESRKYKSSHPLTNLIPSSFSSRFQPFSITYRFFDSFPARVLLRLHGCGVTCGRFTFTPARVLLRLHGCGITCGGIRSNTCPGFVAPWCGMTCGRLSGIPLTMASVPYSQSSPTLVSPGNPRPRPIYTSH